jgi:hypothetical protein
MQIIKISDNYWEERDILTLNKTYLSDTQVKIIEPFQAHRLIYEPPAVTVYRSVFTQQSIIVGFVWLSKQRTNVLLVNSANMLYL